MATRPHKTWFVFPLDGNNIFLPTSSLLAEFLHLQFFLIASFISSFLEGKKHINGFTQWKQSALEELIKKHIFPFMLLYSGTWNHKIWHYGQFPLELQKLWGWCVYLAMNVINCVVITHFFQWVLRQNAKEYIFFPCDY